MLTDEELKAIEDRVGARQHCHDFTGHEKFFDPVYICSKCNDVDRMFRDIEELLAEVKRLREEVTYQRENSASFQRTLVGPPLHSEMLEARIRELSISSRKVIDIRYSPRTGDFWIMASYGNSMQAVAGAHASTIDAALTIAEDRWRNRSLENPF